MSVPPVFCPECVEAGESAFVFSDGGSSTLMNDRKFWDPDGVWHHHDPNFTTWSWHCSNGHAWTTSQKPVCPGCGVPGGDREREPRSASARLVKGSTPDWGPR